MGQHETEFQKYSDKWNPPFIFKNRDAKELGNLEFIEDQDKQIDDVKAQSAMIEVRASSLGNLGFDMPQNIRRSKDKNRPRKDNFTCLLFGCWGAKLYYDLTFTAKEKETFHFEPIIIR